MAILHTCTCGQHLPFDDSRFGTPGRCPACGRTFTVGQSHITAASPALPPPTPVLPDGDEPSPAEARPKRRRKKRKGKRQAKLLSFLPAIALDGTFLGLSVRKWLAIAGSLLVVVLLVWLLVPELGSGPYYTVSRFAEVPSTVDMKTNKANEGIIVHIHRTLAGTVDERIVTRTTIMDLRSRMTRSIEQAEVNCGNIAGQGEHEVDYQIEWRSGRGVVSVKCSGQSVPRGLWSRLWDVDQ